MYNFLKRILDIIGAIVALIICSPIMLVTVLAIKLNSTGPILADTPERVGKNGKLFKMYKFRSMIMDAHYLLHNDPKFKRLFEEYQNSSYKLQNDPRVTRVGKFIRRFSIDEMPQFFNVLNGEMSIVGPRAYYPDELEKQQKVYPNAKEHVKIILSAKPGLTGLWQISGRSEINFDKRVEMDAVYVKRKSILIDLIIILKTVPAVLFGKGAI